MNENDITLVRGLNSDIRAEIEATGESIGKLEARVRALRLALCAVHRSPEADEIIEECAREWGVTTQAVRGRSNLAPIVAARHVSAFLMLAAGMSTVTAGRALVRDHGSAIYARERVRNQVEVDAHFSAKVTATANRLGIALGKKAKKS